MNGNPSAAPGAAPVDVRRPRAAIAGIFLQVGIMLGTWFARLPQFRTELRLSYGALGTVLLAQTVGVIIAMQLAGHLAARAGSRRVIRVIAALVPWFLPVLAVMPGPLSAGAAMLAWGLVAGLLDVAMNAHGVEVERAARRPILNSLHAAWAVGALLGALTTAVAVRMGWSLGAHFAAVAVGLTGIALGCGRHLLASPAAAPAERGPRRGLRAGWSRAVVVLGAIGAAAAFCDGAISSWCGVFLSGPRGAPPSLASIGYASYIVTQTGTRMIGDRLHNRFGAVSLVRSGAAVAVTGVVLAVAVPQVWVGIAGFALQGAGLAMLIPLISGAVGHGGSADGSASATSLAIARYSTLHYAGVVAGPSGIGWLAQALGVSPALLLLVVPLAGIRLLAAATAPASKARSAVAAASTGGAAGDPGGDIGGDLGRQSA